MGWSIGYDSTWNRDIGYGVPAYCDHPECDKEIDRGLAYVCGGEPFGGEHGCGLYFCSDHHSGWRDDDDRDAGTDLCERCEQDELPFTPKPEHPRWIAWKLTDESWQQWRDENPDEVERLEIIADPETMERIRQGEAELERGETVGFEDVFGEPL